MNKRVLCMLLLVLFVVAGCKSTNPADYTTPPLSPGSDNIPEVGIPPNLPIDLIRDYRGTMNKYRDSGIPGLDEKYAQYNAWIDTTYTGADFIHYDDISFVGDFFSYGQINSYGDPSTMHYFQSFGIVDGSGELRRIDINHVPNFELKLDKYREMPDVEDYLHAPKPENLSKTRSTDFYSYRAGTAVYSYFCDYPVREDYTGILAFVTWTFMGSEITVYSFASTAEEITEDSGFVYDLTQPETAQNAINKFNYALLKAYLGNCLVIWGPIVIPVACVAAVGLAFVVKWRRRKKAAAAAEATEEEKE